MQILISSPTKSKLLTNTSQPFLIVNLIGTYFLLTKVKSRDTFDKNINFEIQNKSFYSTFIRHVNLSYSSKLSQLIDNLEIKKRPGLQHQWFMLYQIHNFQTFQSQKYRIYPPSYGIQVIVHNKNKSKVRTKISNLFRLHAQTFYFLSVQPNQIQQCSIITDQTMKIIYGITYFVQQVTICIPFLSICSQKPCPINISPEIKPLLMGTCYIRAGIGYCTGFVKNSKNVISARHVLPFQNQKVGFQVGVRFYPYNEQMNGFISRIGQGGVDIISITIRDGMITKKSTAIEEKNNFLQKKLVQQKLVGKQIVALGFGKFGYSSKIFSKVDIVMPTLQCGIVSKIIKLKNLNVFIKTDASLFNGFSGCGIWYGNKLIGMAVFILKNKNNNSNFNKHNFSFTIDFIFHLLDQNQKQNLISQVNEQIVSFDKVQTRFKVPFTSRL